jgi:hypothetical protein
MHLSSAGRPTSLTFPGYPKKNRLAFPAKTHPARLLARSSRFSVRVSQGYEVVAELLHLTDIAVSKEPLNPIPPSYGT